MAGMSTMMLGRLISRPILHSQNFDQFFRTILVAADFCGPDRPPSMTHMRCAATKAVVDEKKSPARLAEVQRLLYQAEERYKADGGGVEPIPNIILDHVTIGYARSGGPGGQNVNKVNTKVDMRFNVKNAHWVNERVRERIMQMEKGRINKDGEIVFSSSKTRTQQGNAEDALAKLQVFTYQKRKLQVGSWGAEATGKEESPITKESITEKLRWWGQRCTERGTLRITCGSRKAKSNTTFTCL